MLKKLHHANLLIASPEEAESYLRLLCDDLGVNLPNNPDFFPFKMETFGIDDARELKLLASRKTVSASDLSQQSRKIFLITSTRLTLEAQNALLKTFEEPFPGTYFFLATREEGLIVPTLRSRMQTIRISDNPILASKDAEEFLALSIKDRLLFAKKFANTEKNLTIFLDSLLSLLRRRGKEEDLIKRVYNVRRLVREPTLAPRLIIEHLSLVL